MPVIALLVGLALIVIGAIIMINDNDHQQVRGELIVLAGALILLTGLLMQSS
jgi:hypothetical protein